MIENNGKKLHTKKTEILYSKVRPDFKGRDKERNVHYGYAMTRKTKQTSKEKRKDREISTTLLRRTGKAAKVQGIGGKKESKSAIGEIFDKKMVYKLQNEMQSAMGK